MKEKITTLYVWKIWIRFLWKIYNYSLFSTDTFGELCTCKTGKCIIPAVLGTFDLHIFPYVLKTNL